jgi:predicted dehydrogenase
MSAPEPVGIGLIGGGLMGKELAAAVGRWTALEDHPVRPRLAAVCDTSPAALEWFGRVDGVRLTTDRRSLLEDPAVQVVYVALPHNLHEAVMVEVAEAGKDLLGEKPFGVDEGAAERIVAAVERAGIFARCSSEMPYFPGAQLAGSVAASGALGQLIEAKSSFLHSSDLDRQKPINWKRQVRTCGPAGCMADLGMHALHLPLRLGWMPTSLDAWLQNLVPERPDGKGGLAICDTIDNATLFCTTGAGPLTVETKRIAPGNMNTWRFFAVGMDGGIEFSTRTPKTVRRFRVDEGAQVWEHLEVGSQSAFATVTGAIFEFGFADAVLQMWAAYLAERAGALDGRFGCATPREALATHRIYHAALRSAERGQVEPVAPVPEA